MQLRMLPTRYATVIYRDLPAGEYADALRQAGLNEATARFVAAIDASIARWTRRPPPRSPVRRRVITDR